MGVRGSKSNHTKNAAVSPPIVVKIVLIAAVWPFQIADLNSQVNDLRGKL